MRTNGEREKARTRENEAIKHYITIMGTDSTGNRVRDKDRDRDRDRDRATNRTATQQATPHTNTVMCSQQLSSFAAPASGPSPPPPRAVRTLWRLYTALIVTLAHAERERREREKAARSASAPRGEGACPMPSCQPPKRLPLLWDTLSAKESRTERC